MATRYILAHYGDGEPYMETVTENETPFEGTPTYVRAEEYEAVLAALSTLPIAVEAPAELSGPLQWEMADAFEASEADTTAGKMIAVYDVVRSALISSPGKDGGQEVEPVAYAREADIRALTEWGADVSLSSVPMPEYGIRMPLYASPSGSAKHD